MPRRGRIKKRDIAPDPVFSSQLAGRIINKIMWDGRKSLAQRIFYSAMEEVRQKSGKDPLEVLEKAIRNCSPMLEVRPRRVGGATYQVPMEVRAERRSSLGIRWLVEFARSRPERGMVGKLAGEILDAYAGAGGAVKKKEETHRMAEANRAFAHYRW